MSKNLQEDKTLRGVRVLYLGCDLEQGSATIIFFLHDHTGACTLVKELHLQGVEILSYSAGALTKDISDLLRRYRAEPSGQLKAMLASIQQKSKGSNIH